MGLAAPCADRSLGRLGVMSEKRKMIWVKNLETGLVWLVDEAHAVRLVASGKYEVQKERKGAKRRRGTEAHGDAGKRKARKEKSSG